MEKKGEKSFLMTSLLPPNFIFDITLGGVTPEQINGEYRGIVTQLGISTKNITSFEGLKDQVKMKMREAFIKKSGLKPDVKLEDLDVYFIVKETKDNQQDKQITNASEINKLLSLKPSILKMTAFLKD
jgi:hypothetical protein